MKNKTIPPLILPKKPLKVDLVALGASAGGPGTLKSILSQLPGDFPVPIVIVQHMAQGYLPELIIWLQSFCKLTVNMVKFNQSLQPGYIYFAANNLHLTVKKGITPQAILKSASIADSFIPSVTALFSSIATSYPNTAIGGLLTGMGTDGALGLLQMKNSGSITFAQSKETAIIYGMPGEAVALNAANYSLDLGKIPEFLVRMIYKKGLKL